jgi:glycosyltransferase involved in cell wall biosynthesis
VPEFDRESGSRRIFDTVVFLRDLGFSVSFVAQNGSTSGGERYVRALQQRGVAVYCGFDSGLDQLIESGRFDIALCAFWRVGELVLPLVRDVSPATRFIVDSVDLHFLRHARSNYAAFGTIDQALSAEMIRELNTYAAADAVLAVSQKEANLINDITGDPRLAHVLTDNEELSQSPTPLPERHGILFIGNFRHPPNVEAVEYLCKEILPRMDPAVLARHSVSIVGNALNDTIQRFGDGLPQVRMVGWVPSVVPYLERARVTVLPLLNGAGTKRKLLQALMVGTPAVSTSIGVEGFDVRGGEHVLIANEPEAFATSVAQLVRDDEVWERIAARGRDFAVARYGRHSVQQQFEKVISAVLAKEPKSMEVVWTTSTLGDAVSRRRAYRQDIRRIRDVVQTAVPEGATVLVVSKGDEALLELDGRRGWHFPRTAAGVYAGHYPADDEAAIAHLEALRAEGAGYLVVPRTALWWREHYTRFWQHLEGRYSALVRQDDACVVFRLGTPETGGDHRAGRRSAPSKHRVPSDLLQPEQRQNGAQKAVKQRSPIIIFGSPRSGTTYLNQLINQHSDVFISNETRLFVWVHHSLNTLTQREEYLLHHRARFVDHLSAHYPDLIRDFYETMAPNARYWGDKNPHYASENHEGCLDTIARLFPCSRFVHIVRDGRDVVTSLVKKGWVTFDVAHRVWMTHVDNGCAFGRSIRTGEYLELRYEDLIRDDVGIARKIFDFLGIELQPAVVGFCEKQRDRRTPLSKPTRDLDTGVRESAWKSYFTPQEQLRSLQLMGGHLVRYGYETEATLAAAKEELEALCEPDGTPEPFRRIVPDAVGRSC